jgi:hypothetical protein
MQRNLSYILRSYDYRRCSTRAEAGSGLAGLSLVVTIYQPHLLLPIPAYPRRADVRNWVKGPGGPVLGYDALCHSALLCDSQLTLNRPAAAAEERP